MGDSPILLVGLLTVAAVGLHAALRRSLVPPLVAFIALGMLLRLADDRFGVLTGDGQAALGLLQQLGLFALLFRVGLESDLGGLAEQLPRASLVWVGNVVLSAVPGYLVMRHGFGYGPAPSLVAATALTATSVGVALGMWRRYRALDSPRGRLLTDVAELDDLSGIALMAVLFAVLPSLHAGAGGDGALAGAVALEAAIFLVKLGAFAAACLFLREYVEGWVTARLARNGSARDLTVMVAGIGITIAGVAEWIGVSAAVGALFAGLVFSRDPEAVRIDAGFGGIHHLFMPFFFIGIGLALDPQALGGALGLGAALLAVAVLGKVVGAAVPALAATGTAGALLVGISMVPRAEIAMVVMSRGRELGDWAVPAELYAAFVLVAAATCLLSPLALSLAFRRLEGAEPAADD